MFKKLFGRKTNRFEGTTQPVQLIVEAMESRPDTFKFSQESMTHTIISDRLVRTTTITGKDTVTGLEITKTTTILYHTQMNIEGSTHTSPIKLTQEEWQLLKETAGRLVENRKARYEKIKRERLCRRYLS